VNDDLNPRAGIGGNNPPLARSIAAETDFAASVTSFLQDEYRERPIAVMALLEEAREIPKEIEDDATKSKAISLVKRIRDESKALLAFHEKEGTPYLRGKQAVDQWFFGLADKLARRSKTNNPGAADIIMSRVTAYDTAVLAREQERRRLEAAEAERRRLAAEAEQRRRDQEAEQARLAAERARTKGAEKTAVAVEKEAEASAAAVEATVARAAHEDARIATFAKPADIMRTRTEDGTLSTMAQESYAEIVDVDLLDIQALRPFIPLDAWQKYLNAWARVTGYTKQMPGANVGRRPKSVVR